MAKGCCLCSEGARCCMTTVSHAAGEPHLVQQPHMFLNPIPSPCKAISLQATENSLSAINPHTGHGRDACAPGQQHQAGPGDCGLESEGVRKLAKAKWFIEPDHILMMAASKGHVVVHGTCIYCCLRFTRRDMDFRYYLIAFLHL